MSDTSLEITMKDIAYILGVTRATVYNRQKAGELPAGNGLSIVKAAIAIEEKRIADMRERLSSVVADRLVVSI
jgi:hypothetical protein